MHLPYSMWGRGARTQQTTLGWAASQATTNEKIVSLVIKHTVVGAGAEQWKTAIFLGRTPETDRFNSINDIDATHNPILFILQHADPLYPIPH
jgi:hypothetical protein